MKYKLVNLFKSEASTIHELIMDTGKKQLIIPDYQRPYCWSRKNILKMIEDISSGIELIKSRKLDSITFLGTLIFIDSKPNLDIVDGQQRLTTFVLLCMALDNLLSENEPSLEYLKEQCNEFEKCTDMVRSKLKKIMFAHEEKGRGMGENSYYPRIVREKDKGIEKVGDYDIDFASLLWNYKLLKEDKRSHFNDILNEGKNTLITSNYLILKDHIENIIKGDNIKDDSDDGVIIPQMPIAKDILQYPKNQKILDISNTEELKKIYASEINEALSKTIRLLMYTSYVLDYIAVIQVTVTQDEKGAYDSAYDIFEALNTTGEPLSALETFQPSIHRNKDLDGKKLSSSIPYDCKEALTRILNYIYEQYNDSPSKRESTAKNFIYIHGLLFKGKRYPKTLGSQRNYLKKEFETLSPDDKKISFISNLWEIKEFWETHWDITKSTPFLDNNQEAAFCLSTITELNIISAIPILVKFQKNDDYHSAIKATLAFIILWRAYHGGTHDLFKKFEIVMNKFKSNSKQKLGLLELKAEYKNILVEKNILNEEHWTDTVSNNGLGDSNIKIAKVLLLLSHYQTNFDKDGIIWPEKIKIENRSSETKLRLEYTTFSAQHYKTVEHVAPQSIKNTDWSEEFKDPSLLNCIGNLTLLPHSENSKVSNKNWDKKRKFYSIFTSTGDRNEIKQRVNELDSECKLSKAQIESLLGAKELPFIKGLSNVEDWDASFVKERSKHLAKLAYEEIIPWLD